LDEVVGRSLTIDNREGGKMMRYTVNTLD
jgi:hypothetical protein